ncbi:ER degradation-enhancing alpha-mannosidase-like protein 2 [Lycorma delicatula]|uniref:ER degradation-enhancing alpha-mannosidase-like protein 2 n=1 Tax=Lycorma delicatula TaxID=130591 RepID=UPI003F51279A
MIHLKCDIRSLYILICLFFFLSGNEGIGIKKYDKKDLLALREEVREMFQHAYSSYLKYAYPYDELRPLTCDGMDTWGSYSLTLIDALDTLAVMGNYTEFQRVVDIVTTKANFDSNINVSVFETNIRIVGGLLSAHLLSHRAGVELEPGWPCNGPLLRLAEDVAKRLIAAFDTTTGMPYGTVNLRHGVPLGETSVTCTAGVGTFIVEFGTLSRLTGDPVYEEVALNALHALYNHQSPIGLVGNHIDVLTGRWTAQDSGIGAGVDSYFEYLVKGAILLNRPELMAMFNEGRIGINKYLKRGDWYLWVSMQKGQVTLPVFQSLEAYWPGVLSLIGDVDTGMKSIHNYYQVWKQYGFTPEFYNIPQAEVGLNRQSYPLRPELAESAMYLYRATGDPFLLDIGVHILRSIQHSAYTPCGYATIEDTRDHTQENRMESFFLAETTKYLYLLFDPDNFIHNKGQHGTVHTLPSGRECILDAGGYIFNTEAHPLDPGALLCCSDGREEFSTSKSNSYYKSTFQGDRLRNSQAKTTDKGSSRKNDINIGEKLVEGDKSNIKLASAIENEPPVQDKYDYLKNMDKTSTVDVVQLKPIGTVKLKILASQIRLLRDVVEQYLAAPLTEDKVTFKSSKILLRTLCKCLEKFFKNKEFIYNLDNIVRLMRLISETLRILAQELASHFKNIIENDQDSNSSPDTVLKNNSPGLFAENKAETEDLKQIELMRNLIKKLNDFNNEVDEHYETEMVGEDSKESATVEDDSKENIIKDILKLSNKTLLLTADYELEVSSSKVIDPESNDNNAFLPKLNKESWKSEDISYQVDDRERVTPVTRLDSSPLFTDKVDTSTETAVPLPEFVSKFLISSGSGGSDFDPQQLLERIRTGPGYKRNSTWLESYELLSCNPQPFLTRISLSGEFFYSN